MNFLLLPLTPLGPISGALALSVALIAVYWTVRVAREARGHFVPGVAYWAVPGLAALLVAAILDVPALFGVGGAALLLSEYWPGAYRLSTERPAFAWPAVGVVIGAVVLASAAQRTEPLLLVLALALLLAGAASLIAVAAYPREPRAALGFQVRWKTALVPEWPELNVTLTERGAHLKNVSRRKLALGGWSPAGVNAWYRVRGEHGEVLAELRVGQVALLPVGAWDSGVRVWYGNAGAQDSARLFRADWTPAARSSERVLN
ncbi:hypothetical protein [Deinococcus sp.]|uniref:hypothetical protein n=1 Tax=Deinococcus sp. TaxID=47478 RepID=UPI002869A261|nr:hypothetical protein [Deinococcus sp.]